MTQIRPYHNLHISAQAATRDERMQAFVDAAWPLLHPLGVSWIGFYLSADGEEMVLGPRRDKPACSPIGLHGACGQSFRERRSLVVRDVRSLGDGYIACDPRDQAEVVLPLLDMNDAAWGVLDVDSFNVGAFDVSDVHGLAEALARAGLVAGAQARRIAAEPRIV